MCGIAGAVRIPNASAVVAQILSREQHRGHEGAGIVSYDAERGFSGAHGMGLVRDIFDSSSIGEQLPGSMAIGHVRYSTSGSTTLQNVQPFLAHGEGSPIGEFAIAHNGNLTNFASWQEGFLAEGGSLSTTSDTEMFMRRMIASGRADMLEAVRHASIESHGAFAILVMDKERIFAVTDPYGMRPLSVGKYESGYVFASEDHPLEAIGARCVRRINPANIINTAPNQDLVVYAEPGYSRHCSFEHAYFAMPGSSPFNKSVLEMRTACGTSLASVFRHSVDLVSPVPDSGNIYAEALAEALHVPYHAVLLRNHYEGRTFIEPSESERATRVKNKFAVLRELVCGKSIAITDDTAVRFTTLRYIVRMLRDAGAKEVHACIGAPPVVHPCHWGIDTPSTDELPAANFSIEEIRQQLELNSITFLPLEHFRRALGDEKGNKFCTTCFTGIKPIHDQLVPLPRKRS